MHAMLLKHLKLMWIFGRKKSCVRCLLERMRKELTQSLHQCPVQSVVLQSMVFRGGISLGSLSDLAYVLLHLHSSYACKDSLRR